jgi:hypothetical protein
VTRGGDFLLAFIQECIRTNRFAFTPHALTEHTTREGFTPAHGIEAILNGTIIENDAGRSRCIVCGAATGLNLTSAYISKYIHCVCQYDQVHQVIIITMYRPSSAEWISHHTRRRT